MDAEGSSVTADEDLDDLAVIVAFEVSVQYV